MGKHTSAASHLLELAADGIQTFLLFPAGYSISGLQNSQTLPTCSEPGLGITLPGPGQPAGFLSSAPQAGVEPTTSALGEPRSIL